MFGLFTATESHPEAKSMAQYYDDLASAVKNIRASVKEANNDAGFVKAANVIEKLVLLCRDTEKVPAMDAKNINTERSKLLKTIGTDGLIDVQGDASKLLAQKYNALLRDVMNKKYWPVATCPTFLGQSYLTKYAEGFEDRKSHMLNAIDKLDNRINAYDATVKTTYRKQA